jgi:NADH:ubiquinone oxidoreductase subunit K
MRGWEAAADSINPWLALALVLLGLLALASQRRVLKQVLGLSIMLQGALLALVDAGRINDQIEAVQPLVITALVVEAIVMAIALVLIINVVRYHPAGLVDDLTELEG